MGRAMPIASQQAVEPSVRMATLDADGPTGKYFADDGSAYPW